MQTKLTPAHVITPSTPMTGLIRSQAARGHPKGPHGLWGEGYPRVRPAEVKYGRMHGPHARDQSDQEYTTKRMLPRIIQR